MTYGIILRDKRTGWPYWYHEALLDGFVPDRVLDMMGCRFVDEELDLCRLCDAEGRRCHVIVSAILDEDGHEIVPGRKMCPVLFNDAVKPKWKVEEIA